MRGGDQRYLGIEHDAKNSLFVLCAFYIQTNVMNILPNFQHSVDDVD